MNTIDWQQIINDNIQEYIYIIDSNTYELLNVNSALLKKYSLLGDYSNRKCYEFIYNTDKPCPFCKKNELENNQAIEWYKHNTKHNTTHLVKNKLIEVSGKSLFYSSAYNITVEVNRFNYWHDVSAQDKTVIECAKILANKDDLQKSVDKLLQLICEFKQADCVYLFERNYSIHKTKLSNIYQIPKANIRDVADNVVDFDENSNWSKKLSDNDYIFITKENYDDEFHDYYETFILTKEFENALIVPIKLNGIVIAFVAVNNMKNTQGLDVIRNIAMFITNSLLVKHNQEELESMVITLQSEVELNDIMLKCIKTLLDCKDFDMTINTLLKILQGYFYSTRVYIFRLDEQTQTLYDWFEQLNQVKSNISHLCDISFDVVNGWYNTYQNDSIAFIEDISVLDNSTKEYELLLLDEVVSFAISPIIKDGCTIGFLRIDNPETNINELHLLNTLTLLISNHIEKASMTAQLERLSYTDELTNLYNRNFFNNYVEQFKSNVGKNIGVIFADVNGLKLVNDNLGHEYGDKLIKCCANILNNGINGFCFRLGGDEFIIFCEHILEDIFYDKVFELEKYLLNYEDIHISIGYVWYHDIVNIDEAIKEADKNMYTNKKMYYAKKVLDHRSKDQQLKALQNSIDYYS